MRGNHEFQAGRNLTHKYSATLEEVSRALELNRSYDQTWVVRAMSHTNLGGYSETRYDAAQKDFDEAVRLRSAWEEELRVTTEHGRALSKFP